jgi:hypothetical protein
MASTLKGRGYIGGKVGATLVRKVGVTGGSKGRCHRWWLKVEAYIWG